MYKNKRLYLIFLGIVLVILGGIYFFLCSLASRKVNLLFAEAMAKQNSLRGSISVQELTADVWGRVYFKNLSWLDTEGEPVVFIPQGMFKVNTLDVILHRMDMGTIEELMLQDAVFSLAFDETMRLDVIRCQGKSPQQQKPSLTAQKNLNITDFPRMKLELHDCTFNVQYKERYYVLNAVDLLMDSTRRKDVILQLTAGPMGGDIVGEHLDLRGKVLLEEKQPDLHLDLSIDKILPEAMGLKGVKNLADISGTVKGKWQQPLIDGTISFAELDIPALHFNNVHGNFHYQDGVINFLDVQAGLYGGYVNAQGKYYLDSRDYTIKAAGKDMMASLAARSSKINCKVDLNLIMEAEGRTRKVHSYGDFVSGKGSYMLIPFEEISGEFDNKKERLKFTNVVIKTFLGDISTDAFKLVDGVLTIDNISLTGKDGEEIKLDVSNN